MPWAGERPETGVQAARAIGQAAGRVQTAQARKRAEAAPDHLELTAQTGKAAGELERQTPAPAQRKSIF